MNYFRHITSISFLHLTLLHSTQINIQNSPPIPFSHLPNPPVQPLNSSQIINPSLDPHLTSPHLHSTFETQPSKVSRVTRQGFSRRTGSSPSPSPHATWGKLRQAFCFPGLPPHSTVRYGTGPCWKEKRLLLCSLWMND